MTTTPNQPLTTDNTKPAVPIHNLQSVPLAAISPKGSCDIRTYTQSLLQSWEP